MEVNTILELARDMGFDVAAPMDPRKLSFLPEVRDMCSTNKCQNYNCSWSCPPVCGPLEQYRQICSEYSQGVLVQTVIYTQDEYDYEPIFQGEEIHARRFYALINKLLLQTDEVYFMGMGGCRRCEVCTYPQKPCRYPEKMFPSMEACGLLVSDVCKDNDVAYYYGPNTVAYVSCVLLK